MTTSERWILSEWQVVSHRSRVFDEKLIFHRQKTPYAEVDLVMRSADGSRVMIEVKSVSRGFFPALRITQIRRLMRAREYLEELEVTPVRFLLATVSPSFKGALFPEICYFESGAWDTRRS